MPYIKQEDRKKFQHNYDQEEMLEACGIRCDNAGDLNYAITTILKSYMSTKEHHNYALHNEIMGMLECCKQEWYRRRVAPYEDIKIEENGDV